MNWTDLLNRAMELSNVIVNKYGPVAWETMLTLKRIDGIQSLILGLFCFITALIAVNMLKKHWDLKKSLYDETRYGNFGLEDTDPAVVFPTFFIVIFSGVGLINYWGSIWTWVAVFYPELAIAHDIMTKVTQ